MLLLSLKHTLKTLAVALATLALPAPDADAMELDGKCAALLGDSMTWIGGDNCDRERGWSCHFSRMAGAGRIDVYARSGATWTNTAATGVNPDAYSEVLDDNNVIYNQAVRLIAAAKADTLRRPDLIVLYAGANDAWFEARRPGMFNTPEASAGADALPGSVTTLAGSVELACRMLQREFPQAELLLVAPVEMAQAPAERTARVADIIERTGASLGITTLRADRESGLLRRGETGKRRTYTTDGVHTNPAGARLIADYIFAGIKQLSSNQSHK